MPKQVGDRIYVHLSAIDYLPPELLVKVLDAKDCIPDIFGYNVVKVSTKTNEVSFIFAEGFDYLDEPIISGSIKVKDGKCSKIRYESKDNPTIYHGKHLFVAPDYKGFDVEAAQKRYEAWKRSGIPEIKNISKIGRLKYWRDIVLPKLKKAKII